jgi:hypothetical protein
MSHVFVAYLLCTSRSQCSLLAWKMLVGLCESLKEITIFSFSKKKKNDLSCCFERQGLRMAVDSEKCSKQGYCCSHCLPFSTARLITLQDLLSSQNGFEHKVSRRGDNLRWLITVFWEDSFCLCFRAFYSWGLESKRAPQWSLSHIKEILVTSWLSTVLVFDM